MLVSRILGFTSKIVGGEMIATFDFCLKSYNFPTGTGQDGQVIWRRSMYPIEVLLQFHKGFKVVF